MAQSESETLALLLEAGRLLSSKLDIGDLLKTVLELSTRVVDAERASLLLLDEKKQELYFDVALGLGEVAAKVRLKMGQGIAGSVAQSLKPEIINDVHLDPRWSPMMDEQSGYVTRSILAVPMMLKGRLIGVVEAINKRHGRFTQKDESNFEAFASQAAVAVENARLFSSLKEEKFKLDTIFAQMANGAVLTDEKARILLANQAARKFMGSTSAMNLPEALRDMQVSPSLQDILAGQVPEQIFEATRDKPKKLILAGKAIRIELGSQSFGPAKAASRTGWLYIFQDVTDERLRENLKRTFLALISHKLKTPLASVTGYADLLVEELENDPGDQMRLKAAQTISTQGKKLSELVDKLLHYTTLESPDDTLELVPCKLGEIVEETLKGMDDWLFENGAEVDFKHAKDTSILGDKNRLRDVVKNLVENAVKFDPKSTKTVEVSVAGEDGHVRFVVSDSGPGIPPEDQDRIFSLFHQIEEAFTGQVEGWGLGLPFVKKVVDQHGGKIRIQSRLGAGTVVTVTFPRKPA